MSLTNQDSLTFLTILGVTEILCSFKLVLEGKTGKEIPESSKLEFLEKFSANNFALSDAEDNTSGPLNRGGITVFPLLRTLLAICPNSQEPSFWEVMDSFVLLAFASLQLQEPFCNIASLSELYFRFRRFTVLVETKKVIYMNYGSQTSC